MIHLGEDEAEPLGRSIRDGSEFRARSPQDFQNGSCGHEIDADEFKSIMPDKSQYPPTSRPLSDIWMGGTPATIKPESLSMPIDPIEVDDDRVDFTGACLDHAEVFELKRWFAKQLTILESSLTDNISLLRADLSLSKLQRSGKAIQAYAVHEVTDTTCVSSDRSHLCRQVDSQLDPPYGGYTSANHVPCNFMPYTPRESSPVATSIGAVHTVANTKPPDAEFASCVHDPSLDEVAPITMVETVGVPKVSTELCLNKPDRKTKPRSSVARLSSVRLSDRKSEGGRTLTMSTSNNNFFNKDPTRDTLDLKDFHYNERSLADILLENTPPFVIMANAITIGVSADLEPKSLVWKILEAIFIFCYTVEFLTKVYLFGLKTYFLGADRKWNLFDFMCLSISYGELAIMEIMSATDGGSELGLLKILRLARLARLIRALHFRIFDELKQMMLGVVAGFRVLMWAIVLLLVCMFILGVALASLIGSNNDGTEEGFETVPKSMLTVFRCFTDGCTTYTGAPLGVRLFDKYGVGFLLAYVLAFMFLSVGVFNLIMAIFIDNVVTRSMKRKLVELGSNQDVTEQRIKETLAKLIITYHPDWAARLSLSGATTSQGVGGRISLDKAIVDYAQAFVEMADHDLVVSKELFKEWLSNDEMHEMLSKADIEVAEKMGLFDVLDVDMGGSLGLDELITGLMKLRGPTTKSDIVAVRLKVSYMTGLLEEMWRKIIGGDGDDGIED